MLVSPYYKRVPLPSPDLKRQHPQGAESPVESCHRHDRYYLEDGVIFQVQNTLFKIPRYILVHESPVFEDMFRMPNYDQSEGIADTAPIRLPQVQVVDFERLLEFLYPLKFVNSTTGMKHWGESEWKSILLLASRWEMLEIRSQAIVKLDVCARPTTKVLLGRAFDHPPWIRDGYLRLCLQDSPVAMDDVEGMGLKEIIGISAARERIRLHVIIPSSITSLSCTLDVCGRIRLDYDKCFDISEDFYQDERVHKILDEVFDLPKNHSDSD